MNLKLGIFICVVAILALVVPAAADNSTSKDNNTATVYGRVYSMDTFEPLDNAVVEINSIPSQSMVATYGVYSFELAPEIILLQPSITRTALLPIQWMMLSM